MRSWMMIVFMAAAFSGAVLSTAAAQDYPHEIQARFETARNDCKDAAGHGPDTKGVIFKPKAIRKLDLTGDRRDDYILDYAHVSCDDNSAYFCGSGGCTLAILVTKRDGSLATVYDDQVLAYELSKGRAPYAITLSLHPADCPSSNTAACVKRARITVKPLALKQVKR
jgi:hypothetical protein